MLQFSEDNPLSHESIARLGPDILQSKFNIKEASETLNERGRMKLADLLLDQTFVAGIGNKYKSEILFLRKLWPFRLANSLSPSEQQPFSTIWSRFSLICFRYFVIMSHVEVPVFFTDCFTFIGTCYFRIIFCPVF